MAGLIDKLKERKVNIGAGAGQAEADPKIGQVLDIEVARIEADPGQPRKHFDPEALQALAASILEHGLLQPIVVRQTGPLFEEGGKLIIVAGERRWRAHRLAGLTRIKATIIKSEHTAILQLVENLHRETLRPLEEAEAMAKLLNEEGYSQTALAEILGRSKASISETLSLVELPVETKVELREGAEVPKRELIQQVREKRRSTRRTLEDNTPDMFPAPAPVREPEQDTWDLMMASLKVALGRHQGAQDRWEERRQKGLSDKELREAISYEFGISGGFAHGEGIHGHFKGGSKPAFWYSFHVPGDAKPTIQGAELVSTVRELMEISYPEDAPGKQGPKDTPPKEPTKHDQVKEDKRWRHMVRGKIADLRGYVGAYAESERHMKEQSAEELQDLRDRLDILLPVLRSLDRKVTRALKEREA